MMRRDAKPWLTLAMFGIVSAAPLRGQDPRDALVARAFKEFDPARRQQMLVPALNPTLGPLRGAWPAGVQLLAQTLIEDGKDSTAAVWLRWAIRLSPDLQPDSVLFLPEVIAAYRTARDFVLRTRQVADSVTATRWVWPAQTNGEKTGRLEIAAAGATGVQVRGAGPIGTGANVSLNPGSYQISAIASGVDTVWITRELLPGITTILEFHPPPAAPRVAIKPPRKGKGFPVVWVGIAAVGAAGLAAFLATNATEPPAETGGIIVTFPNP